MLESYLPVGSSYASDIDNLFTLIFVLVGFWFVLCVVVFFWLIFKFRAREGQAAEYITGEEKHQKRWITIPHMLVLVCDVFIIWGAVVVWYEIKQEIPEYQQEVRLISQQWAWTFVHPGPDGKLDSADDIYAVNELHVEKGVVYKYFLESTDVLHDFSVPIFRLKQDSIPGRIITGWFEPTLLGEYDIQCAEICGIGHGLMVARLFVESPEQHAAWINKESPLKLADAKPRRAMGEL